MLVEVPLIARLGTASLQLIGVLLPELQTSLTYCFIDHDDPAFRQHLVDITVAEVKAIG
jgi:hypothetical protein